MKHTLLDHIDEAAGMYEAGASSEEVGARFGGASLTVLKYLKAHGVTIRKPGQRLNGSPKRLLSPEQELSVVGKYIEGAPTRQLAVEMGVSQDTIRKILVRRGETIRPRDTSRRVPDERLLELHTRYLESESMENLAREVGYAPAGLAAAFKALGLPARPKGKRPIPMDDPRMARALMAWDSGIGFKRAARDAGLGETTLRKCMRETGRDPSSRRWGPGHSHWKGGRQVTTGGYVRIWIAPDDPLAAMGNNRGFVLEHRLIMARHLARVLKRQETIHHINGIKDDNRLENLELRQGQHGKNQAFKCADCGSRNIVPVNLG
jgi:HNH endonuclease